MPKFYRFNLKGDLLVEKTFDQVSYPFGKNPVKIPVKKGKKWAVALYDNLEVITPFQYDRDDLAEHNHIYYNDILDSEYIYISKDYFKVKSENGLVGLVNAEKKLLIEAKYKSILKLEDNLFLLQDHTSFVLSNNLGEIISNKIVATRIVEKSVKINDERKINYFLIIINEKIFGVADRNFNLVLDCKYDNYIDFTNNDTFFAVSNGINLVLNKQNSVVKKFDFTFVFRDEVKMQNGDFCYLITKDNSYEAKYGILNNNYELIVPMEYNYIEYSKSVFIVKKGRSDYLLNEKFEIIPNVKYKEIGRFEEEGIACTKDEDLKYRFVDFNGNVLSDFIFDRVFMGERRSLLLNLFTSGFQKSSYKSGLCGVLYNSKWGYVDIKGKLVINCQFDDITEFNNRRNAIVKYNGKWGVIDDLGNSIIPFEFDNIVDYNMENKLIISILEDKFGLIDFDNNIIIDHEYDNIDFNDEKILIGYAKKPIPKKTNNKVKVVEPIDLLESNFLEKNSTLIHDNLKRVMVLAVVTGEEDDLSNRLYIIDVIKKDNTSATFISGYAGGGVWDECTFLNDKEYNGEEGGFTVFEYIKDDQYVNNLVADYICEIDDELDEYQYKSLKYFTNVGKEDLKVLYSVWYNETEDYSQISKNDKKRFKKLLKSTGGIWWKDWNFKF